MKNFHEFLGEKKKEEYQQLNIKFVWSSNRTRNAKYVLARSLKHPSPGRGGGGGSLPSLHVVGRLFGIRLQERHQIMLLPEVVGKGITLGKPPAERRQKTDQMTKLPWEMNQIMPFPPRYVAKQFNSNAS